MMFREDEAWGTWLAMSEDGRRVVLYAWQGESWSARAVLDETGRVLGEWIAELLGEEAAAKVVATKRSEAMATVTEAETKPEALVLAVYPHPLRNRGMLMLGLPEAAKVRVVVYDVLGRKVGVLLAGLQSAGWHQIALDAQRWPSGGRVAGRSGRSAHPAPTAEAVR